MSGFYVSDEFRKNTLSVTPGGSTVTIYYGDDFKIYDKIKNPKAYIQSVLGKDFNITSVEVDGTLFWKKTK
jgi:hypothetical protein